MTIDKIIKDFREKFVHDSCDLPDEGKCDCGLESFLISSLKTVAEAAVESTGVEEKEVHDKKAFGKENIGKMVTDKLLREIIKVAKDNSWNASSAESQRRGKEWIKQFTE